MKDNEALRRLTARIGKSRSRRRWAKRHPRQIVLTSSVSRLRTSLVPRPVDSRCSRFVATRSNEVAYVRVARALRLRRVRRHRGVRVRCASVPHQPDASRPPALDGGGVRLRRALSVVRQRAPPRAQPPALVRGRVQRRAHRHDPARERAAHAAVLPHRARARRVPRRAVPARGDARGGVAASPAGAATRPRVSRPGRVSRVSR